MQDDEFEWDDAKAAKNRQDHAVTFEMACDAFAIDWIDHRQADAEARMNMLAAIGNRILHVPYTLRGDSIRIISAQKPEPHERRRYHNENREA